MEATVQRVFQTLNIWDHQCVLCAEKKQDDSQVQQFILFKVIATIKCVANHNLYWCASVLITSCRSTNIALTAAGFWFFFWQHSDISGPKHPVRHRYSRAIGAKYWSSHIELSEKEAWHDVYPATVPLQFNWIQIDTTPFLSPYWQ